MRKYPKFCEFIEAKKEKGFADVGLSPANPVPPEKKPKPLDTTNSLAGHPEYKGQLATRPPQYATKGSKEKPLPYKAPGEAESGFVITADDKPSGKDGLAYEKTPNLTPQNSAPMGTDPEPKTRVVKSHPYKETTEEFIEATKNMSDTEFAKFMLEHEEPIPQVSDLYGNQFTPDPMQTISYITAIASKNPRMMGRLIREMKRQGKLDMLLNELSDHNEYYDVVVQGMRDPEHGKKRCHRMAKAMNDQYMNEVDKFVFEQVEPHAPGGIPMGMDTGMSMRPKPRPNPAIPQRQIQPDLGAGPAGPMTGGMPTGMLGAAGGMSSPSMPQAPGGGPEGGPGGGGINSDPAANQGGATGGGSNVLAGPKGGGQAPDFGQGPVNAPKQPPKMKGESSHMNLIGEMGSFPMIFTDMTNHCIGNRCH